MHFQVIKKSNKKFDFDNKNTSYAIILIIKYYNVIYKSKKVNQFIITLFKEKQKLIL